jgi:hypothetical protein
MLSTAVTSLCCKITPLSKAGLQNITVINKNTAMAIRCGVMALKLMFFMKRFYSKAAN